MININLRDVVIANHYKDEIPVIDAVALRNKSISELKQTVFANKKDLETIQECKKNLTEAKQSKLAYYDSGFLPQLTKIFHEVTNYQYSEVDEADIEISHCEAQEDIINGNLNILENQIRMKELARVQDWWQENENLFASNMSPDEFTAFRKAVFNQLTELLDLDESAFDEVTANLRTYLDKSDEG